MGPPRDPPRQGSWLHHLHPPLPVDAKDERALALKLCLARVKKGCTST